MKTFFSDFGKKLNNVKIKFFKTAVVVCVFSLTISLFSCGEEGINLNQTGGNNTANVVVFSYKDDEFIFTVRGYGHGVGLSQVGANYMAKEGANFEEILSHYYPGTELKEYS